MFISTLLLQSKLLEKGLEDAMKSDSQLINGLLGSALIGVIVLAGLAFKYLINKNKEALATARESFAKETAINEGGHQNTIKAKDDIIKAKNDHIEHQNEELAVLREKYSELIRDNTEAFRQIGSKIGQSNEGQATIAAILNQNHSDMKLYIFTEVSKAK